MRSVVGRCLVGAVALITLAACGSSAGKAAKTVVRDRTVVHTVPATPTPSEPVLTDSAVPTDVGGTAGALPSVSGVVDPNRSGSNLTLDDFFQADYDWSQEVVSVASQKGVSGIRGDVNCGSSASLELRLNDAFQTLKFDSAQDNTSPSSSTTMVVSVAVNGHQVTAKQVAFNKVQKLTVNVASANAVVITFTESDSNECGETYPVLFNAVLS